MAHQALLLAAATGGSQVLVAVLYLLAARGVTPSEFGSTVAGIALGTAAAGFIDFGTNNHWTRELARGTLALDEFNGRLLSKIVIALLAAAVWCGATLLLVPGSLIWIAGPIAVALVANQACQVQLRSAARGDLVALVIVADRVFASVIFFVLLAVSVSTPTALWISLSVGSIGAAILGRRLSQHGGRTARVRFRFPWRGAHYFGLTVVATSSQALDLTLLSSVAGSAAAGVYGAVSRWTQPMSLLAAAFSSALAPYAARSADLRATWLEVRRAIWMPAAAIVLALAVFFAAPAVVDLLLGGSYSGSAAVLQVLALVVIPSIICQPLVVVLQAMHRDRFVAVVMLIAALGQLTLVAVLARGAGALGAATAALVAQLFIFIALGVGVFRLRARQSSGVPK
ncbi:polysaccharide biosynthesis C-terminal domain-containing protein [Curtobacterium sp. MCBA15_004]|uniref:polysaccharide biosynthesis C-terminal domain-containing protein n=1 Tax=Curtobacterium sp. MCBA15_004 TaxID=1898733 RepID=UPI001114ECF5|nr:polysaccharide biosynthesis C-terminal domain-containing protein [Curtobacterium sp. MCBA15_004]WIA97406.1 polysaccharide biosynthesis C-terminal domain-containing protein [Curtobacterium sp. MCBA15_004]